MDERFAGLQVNRGELQLLWRVRLSWCVRGVQ
jgi:hypothetical protein